jgi:hypothetical protein
LSAAADNVQRWLDARWPEGVSVRRVVVSVEELSELLPRFGPEG